MFSRRQLLLGVAAGGALAATAYRLWPRTAPAFNAGPDDRALLLALAPALLGPALPVDVQRLSAHVWQAIAGLPPATQAELRQLFDLLQQPLARRLLAGVSAPWPEATADDIRAFLLRWRYSRLALLRGAYQALHSLLYAACYGDSTAWPAIGYRLPPSIEGLL